jgi:hypothetical protein
MGDKRKLTKEILRSHGITYNIYTCFGTTRLTHVKTLRDGLVNFDGFLCKSVVENILGEDTVKDSRIPNDAYRDSGMLEGWQEAKEQNFIRTAQKLSRKAEGLHRDRAPEAEWLGLLIETILKQRETPYYNMW